MKQYYIQDMNSNKYVKKDFANDYSLTEKGLATMFSENQIQDVLQTCKRTFSKKRMFKPLLVPNEEVITKEDVTIFEKDNFSWKFLVNVLSDIQGEKDKFILDERERLSYCDKAIIDLLHYLENDNLLDEQKTKIVNLLVKFRKERRKHKINLNMLKHYNNNDLKGMKEELKYSEHINYEPKVLKYTEI